MNAADDQLYAPDFRCEPYWWEAAPRRQLTTAVPKAVDVLVVGSGYTGLSAAIQTARGGRSTLVVDAGDAGWGCSSRNGGQVLSLFKHGPRELAASYGPRLALEMQLEGYRSMDYLESFIETENIRCHWERCGHFVGAHNPRQYEYLARSMAAQPPECKEQCFLVSRSEQRREVGTDVYHGGAVYPLQAALHPALYHDGLLKCALASGVGIAGRCRVLGLQREPGGQRVITTGGSILARDVVLATNGYTGGSAPWHRRRVVPIGSYMIATEELPASLAAELVPRGRTLADTRRVVFYYRLSPDGKRMLFGGRVAYMEQDPRISAPRLYRAMTAVFPQLAGIRLSYSWMGFVAFSFDALPHFGTRERIHYAMGYCGVGIALGSYLGMRLGQRILGLPAGTTAFERVPFRSRPFYSGHPWFLAPSILWYRCLDKLPI